VFDPTAPGPSWLLLRRRVARSRLAALFFAALACGAGWALWHFWQTAWNQPLSTTLTAIHAPAEVFNERGALEVPFTPTVHGLNLMAFLLAAGTLLLRRGYDGRHRFIINVTGLGCAAMTLGFAWIVQQDARVNGDVRILADQGEYAQLQRLTRARPQIPYSSYIGAQALVLAGGQDKLRQEYGPWLQKWAALAAEHGYLKPGMDPRHVRAWEGRSAAPRVMRALEIIAFDSGISVFSQEYEVQVRRDVALAGRWGPAAAAAFGLGCALAILSALRARVLRRRMREIERQVADIVAHRSDRRSAREGRELPPIEFTP